MPNNWNILYLIIFLVSLSRPGFSQNQIRITEIMADPDPPVGLPLAEYVEVYNASEQIIDLSNWTLSDPVLDGNLSGKLSPGEYLVLTGTEHADEFNGINVCAVQPWPTLNNASDKLLLRNTLGQLIDSVYYSVNWHSSSDKKNGGWSLERITTPCSDKWSSSIDNSGGTPGKPNSLTKPYDDGENPVCRYSFAVTEKSVKFVFSKELDISAMDGSSVQLSDGLQLRKLTGGVTTDTVYLLVEPSVEFGKSYVATFSNILDCAGNRTSLTVDFNRLRQNQEAELCINEVLFDPVSGGQDFIEVINYGEDVTSIADTKFRRYDENEGILKLVGEAEIGNQVEILLPGELNYFSKDVEVVKNNYPLSYGNGGYNISLFNIPDDGAILTWVNKQGMLLDSIRIDPAWHHSWITDKQGYSLERINPERVAYTRDNWGTSAAGATPGIENSQYRGVEISLKTGVQIDPEVIYPHRANQESTAIISYSFKHEGLVADIGIFDLEGHRRYILAENQLIGTHGQFRWDGIDDYGNILPTGYYLVYFRVLGADGFRQIIKDRVVVVTEN